MKPFLAKLLVATSLCGACASSQAWTHYSVRSVALDVPPDVQVFADDINNLGHVLVSTVGLGGDVGYFVCRDDGCDLVGNNRTMVIHALNDLDELAGAIFEAHSYAFVGSKKIGYGRGACNGCGFGLDSEAFDSNSAGEATGFAQFGLAGTQAFKYTKATGLVSLGTLGGTSSVGGHINKHGNVVGTSLLPGDTDTHGFLYARGIMTDLGSLGGRQTSALALNDHDTVVGCSLLADNLTLRAFRYETGVMAELPALGSGPSCAQAINNHGVAVGYSTGIGGARAVIFKGDKIKNLNRLLDTASGQGWTLHDAVDINAAGVIVGNGSYKGQTRVFVLTPIVP